MRPAKLLLAGLIAALILMPDKVWAEDGTSLSIYPPVIEIQTTPPSSPSIPITLQNNLENDVSLAIKLIPFKTDNITGELLLNPEGINEGMYKYYADKIQFLVDGKKTDTLSLQPLEYKDVTLSVNLEKGDPPGDYYFSIVFLNSGSTPGNTSTAQIPTGIGTNLLLSIGPKKPSIGVISEFTTSFFKAKGPVEFNLKLHNASDHLVEPTGQITIHNMLGQTVGAINILPQYLLAKSDRYLVDSLQASPSADLAATLGTKTPFALWPEKFLFGIYKATAKIRLDDNSQPMTRDVYFVAFPLYFFFIITIALFVGISIYLRVKRKI